MYKGLTEQMTKVSSNPDSYYKDLTLEKLEEFLLRLVNSTEGRKAIKYRDYWTVRDLGNGLYQCGDIVCGKQGLEQLDKALRDKTKEFIDK